MPVAVQRRLIPDIISEEREERIDIFCLVIGPQCRIEDLPSGSMHISVPRPDDTLGSPYLGKPELRIYDTVRCLEYQAAVYVIADEIHPRGIFPGRVTLYRQLSGTVPLKDCSK